MPEELADMDEVFLTGNFSKIQPVIQVANNNYAVGPVATHCRKLYFEFAKREGRRTCK